MKMKPCHAEHRHHTVTLCSYAGGQGFCCTFVHVGGCTCSGWVGGWRRVTYRPLSRKLVGGKVVCDGRKRVRTVHNRVRLVSPLCVTECGEVREDCQRRACRPKVAFKAAGRQHGRAVAVAAAEDSRVITAVTARRPRRLGHLYACMYA